MFLSTEKNYTRALLRCKILFSGRIKNKSFIRKDFNFVLELSAFTLFCCMQSWSVQALCVDSKSGRED